jgi:hypothetical protein
MNASSPVTDDGQMARRVKGSYEIGLDPNRTGAANMVGFVTSIAFGFSVMAAGNVWYRRRP